MKLFGKWSLPDWFYKSIDTTVEIFGPQVVCFTVRIKHIGEFISVMTFTPLKPFEQYSYISTWCSSWKMRWMWS